MGKLVLIFLGFKKKREFRQLVLLVLFVYPLRCEVSRCKYTHACTQTHTHSRRASLCEVKSRALDTNRPAHPEVAEGPDPVVL